MKNRIVTFALSLMSIVAFATSHAEMTAIFFAASLVVYGLRRDGE